MYVYTIDIKTSITKFYECTTRPTKHPGLYIIQTTSGNEYTRKIGSLEQTQYHPREGILLLLSSIEPKEDSWDKLKRLVLRFKRRGGKLPRLYYPSLGPASTQEVPLDGLIDLTIEFSHYV